MKEFNAREAREISKKLEKRVIEKEKAFKLATEKLNNAKTDDEKLDAVLSHLKIDVEEENVELVKFIFNDGYGNKLLLDLRKLGYDLCECQSWGNDVLSLSWFPDSKYYETEIREFKTIKHIAGAKFPKYSKIVFK